MTRPPDIQTYTHVQTPFIRSLQDLCGACAEKSFRWLIALAMESMQWSRKQLLWIGGPLLYSGLSIIRLLIHTYVWPGHWGVQHAVVTVTEPL